MEGRGLPGAAADDQTAGRVDENIAMAAVVLFKKHKIGPHSLLSERLWDEGRWSHAISMLMTTHIKRINVASMWPRNLTPRMVCVRARVSACVTETQDCNRNGLARTIRAKRSTAGIMSAFREM